MTISIGFTGTQHGMSGRQEQAFTYLLQRLRGGPVRLPDIILHHGDCLGADKEAHDIALDCSIRKVVIHPPIKTAYAANCQQSLKSPTIVLRRPKFQYLERNHHIVDASDFLVAAPGQMAEMIRSGTWATVRYARKQSKFVFILDP